MRANQQTDRVWYLAKVSLFKIIKVIFHPLRFSFHFFMAIKKTRHCESRARFFFALAFHLLSCKTTQDPRQHKVFTSLGQVLVRCEL